MFSLLFENEVLISMVEISKFPKELGDKALYSLSIIIKFSE